MSQVTKEFLIQSMHTMPQNPTEIGFNSALIMILKRLVDSGDVTHVGTDIDRFRAACTDATVYSRLSGPAISAIMLSYNGGAKLEAIKQLKKYSGLRLMEAKDIIDMIKP